MLVLFENIAVHTGSSRVGYCTLGSNVNAKLQRGSSLSLSNQTPQWVAYYALQKFGTSQVIIFGATTIDTEWYKDFPAFEELHNLEEFKCGAVLEELPIPLSSAMRRHLEKDRSVIPKLETQGEELKIIL